MTVTRNASLRVSNVTATGASGTTSISGATMRSVLGLRSTWFTIGVMRITGGGTIDRGQTKVLPALARNLTRVHLQRRRLNESTWTNLREVNGAVSIRAHPTVTTLYRLSSASGANRGVRVNVRRPCVHRRVHEPVAERLRRAELAGEVVQVQRQTPGGRGDRRQRDRVREDGPGQRISRSCRGSNRPTGRAGGGIAGTSRGRSPSSPARPRCFDEMVAVPPGRAARPETASQSRP